MSGPAGTAAEGTMGSGYGRHSRVQHRAADHGMPLLRRALEAVPLPVDGAPFRAADLGVAAGTNSLDPMRAVVEGVRARTGENTPVTVVHTDILTNDFNTTFATIMDTPGSYAHEPEVHVHAQARSFYEPLFPPGDLHLAWSSIAVHWLSRVPAPVRDHVFSTRATGAVREALRERSRVDWERFLAHRARELRPGGQLVVLGGAAADDGASGAEALMDTADAALRELTSEGLITRDEYERMTIPTWNRTREEFLAPLGSGPPASPLRLEESDLIRLPDIHLDRFHESGDAGGFADAVTAFFTAAFTPSLLSALDPTTDVERVADAFTAALHDRVESAPEDVETHWHVMALRVGRV